MKLRTIFLSGLFRSSLIFLSLAAISPLAHAAPPVIEFAWYNDYDIVEGQNTILGWNVTGATSVSIDQGIGTVQAWGIVLVAPLTTTTYTMTATGPDGTTTASMKVTVAPFTTMCVGGAPECVFIRSLETQGKAAGNKGDFYQNSDLISSPPPPTQHSGPDLQDLVQVVRLKPLAPSSISATFPGKVVFGNASIVVGFQGSIGRVRTLSATGAASSYLQYRENDAFWYPGHDDAAPGVDLYHAMSPTSNSSIGASGSEISNLKSFFFVSAALQPAVKATLVEKGLLVPTIQMILRRARVASDAEYLTGKAHPSFFTHTPTLEMVKLASTIEPNTIPPMVQLSVTNDNYTDQQGRDFFDTHTVQRYFDIPVSVSRLWRGLGYTKHMHASAAQSFDVNNRSLTYHWKVLRGDPARVRITPTTANQSEVDIEIDYQPEWTIQDSVDPGMLRTTNLTVIGCFVHNGAFYSAPGYVTSYTFPNERRTYDPVTHQIQEVNYENRNTLAAIGANRTWERDRFHYDASHVLQGWYRTKGAAVTLFTPEGYQVVAQDAAGRVTQAINVQYTSVQNLTDWVTTGASFAYTGNAILPPITGGGNQLPVASQLSASTPANTAVSITLSASDLDNDPLTYSIVSAPAHGTLSGTGASRIYTPTTGYAGPDSFTYKANDGKADSNVATVTITILNPPSVSVSLSPPSVGLIPSQTQQFTATVSGTSNTGVNWSLNPTIGTISSGGLYTAPASIPSAQTVRLRATSQADPSKFAEATLFLNPPSNGHPTVATPASVSQNPMTGTTTNLSVLGSDDGGEANLTYTWAVTGTPPASVNFNANGTNATKNVTVTFNKTGPYSFQVTIRDAGGLTVTSSVDVTVNALLTTLRVTPSLANISVNGTQVFTASGIDQFGQTMPSPTSFVWNISGGGSISNSGFFTAGSMAGGPFTVTATSGGKNGTASVTVTDGSPPPVLLPDPILSGLEGRTFTLQDELSFNYAAPATGFNWVFTSQRSQAASHLFLSAKTLSSSGAPVITGAPHLNLGSQISTIGPYEVKVQAVNGTQTSNWAIAHINVVGTNSLQINVYPNPWRKDRHAGSLITFTGLTSGSTVKLFTVSGHQVKSLTESGGQASWDLTNDKGDKAASGIYMYLVTDGEENKVKGKIAVIR